MTEWGIGFVYGIIAGTLTMACANIFAWILWDLIDNKNRSSKQ